MRVLVTGGNGHLGFNLCAELVRQGRHEVRASVRSLSDPVRTQALSGLGAVDLVELDIRDLQGFEAALEGIDVLFHVAATYTVRFDGPDQAESMVQDSVEGARNAMRAASAAGVSKVVLTSSVVTLPAGAPGDPPMDESSWQEDPYIPYFRAKVEGERMAWCEAEALGLRLVTLLPAGIGGPGFSRRTPTIDLIEGLLLGSMRFGAPPLNFSYVDARDAARGHILAAEADVGGRFILCNDTQPSIREWSQAMHEADPAAPAAPWVLPELLLPWLPWFEAVNERLIGAPRFATEEGLAGARGKVLNYSNARARRELGWVPEHSFVESLRDTSVALRQLRRREGHRRVI